MDFEKLIKIIPKQPEKWTMDDVSKWLDFIGLGLYAKNFTEASIDGSSILLLENEDLVNDLGINSGIIRKKILNWIQNGLVEYSQYIVNTSSKSLLSSLYKKNGRTQSMAGLWGKNFNRESLDYYNSVSLNEACVDRSTNSFRKKAVNSVSVKNLHNMPNMPNECVDPAQDMQPPSRPLVSENPSKTENKSTHYNPLMKQGSIRLKSLLSDENRGEATQIHHYGSSKMETEAINENNITVNTKSSKQLLYRNLLQNMMGDDKGAQANEKKRRLSTNSNPIKTPPHLFFCYEAGNPSAALKKDKENIDNMNYANKESLARGIKQGKKSNLHELISNVNPRPLNKLNNNDQQLHRLLQNKKVTEIDNLMEEEIDDEEECNRNSISSLTNSFHMEITENPPKSDMINENQCEACELIIQPVDASQNTFYCINERGGNIGRHSSNHIVVLEESVSRFHGQIIYKNGDFFLKDKGSTTGSYLKITENIILDKGMIIEMGSNQFSVENPQCRTNSGSLVLHVIEGVDQGKRFNVNLCGQAQSYTIGRKPTSDLVFGNDNHLSNIHAKIFILNNHFILEDLSSTNGTWRRLSIEGKESSLFVLQDGGIFKIGGTSVFQVKKNKDTPLSPRKEKDTDDCLICHVNERDSLYMPCKHNACCVKCSGKLEDCPVCGLKIEEKIKIFRS